MCIDFFSNQAIIFIFMTRCLGLARWSSPFEFEYENDPNNLASNLQLEIYSLNMDVSGHEIAMVTCLAQNQVGK